MLLHRIACEFQKLGEPSRYRAELWHHRRRRRVETTDVCEGSAPPTSVTAPRSDSSRNQATTSGATSEGKGRLPPSRLSAALGAALDLQNFST